MSAPSAKEALEALRVVREFMPHADFLGPPWAELAVIQRALEAAAVEAEAWAKIEKYCRRKQSHFMLDCERGYEWSFVGAEPDRINPLTRLGALQAAAAWVEKEGAK